MYFELTIKNLFLFQWQLRRLYAITLNQLSSSDEVGGLYFCFSGSYIRSLSSATITEGVSSFAKKENKENVKPKYYNYQSKENVKPKENVL